MTVPEHTVSDDYNIVARCRCGHCGAALGAPCIDAPWGFVHITRWITAMKQTNQSEVRTR